MSVMAMFPRPETIPEPLKIQHNSTHLQVSAVKAKPATTYRSISDQAVFDQNSLVWRSGPRTSCQNSIDQKVDHVEQSASAPDCLPWQSDESRPPALTNPRDLPALNEEGRTSHFDVQIPQQIRTNGEEESTQLVWQEYELPEELSFLEPGVPDDIRNIVQESLDEHQALRLSMLHVLAFPVEQAGQILGSDRINFEYAPESSLMATSRSANSSGSDTRSRDKDPLAGKQSLDRGSSGRCETDLASPKGHSSDSVKPSTAKLPKAPERSTTSHAFLKLLRHPRQSRAATLKDTTRDGGKGKCKLNGRQKPPENLEPVLSECLGCFEELSREEVVGMPCRHDYCKFCFQKLVDTSIQDEHQFPPKCCLQEIPRGVLKKNLSASNLATFDKKVLEYSIPVGSRFYCARPECSKWIDTTRVKSQNGALVCPYCRFGMCTTCRGPEHQAGQDCPQDFGLDATLQRAEKEGWQRCYSCKAMVELNTGCRHITCRCTAQFWSDTLC